MRCGRSKILIIIRTKKSDSRNHCVPLLNVLQDPQDDDVYYSFYLSFASTMILFLTPLAKQSNFYIKYSRDCMTQCHERNVSEPLPPFRSLFTPDLKAPPNISLEPERPTKYYIIDFGLSRTFDPSDSSPKVLPVLGGDRSVPEFQANPIARAAESVPTDVYYLGNLVREDFLQPTWCKAIPRTSYDGRGSLSFRDSIELRFWKCELDWWRRRRLA
ncbi:hypothetical protein B0H21DRAFT_858728 [Amylocystis lapponica]|nr:hypothetical protein B0H21DRAFT_858728 [Amylocystis lapponica]